MKLISGKVHTRQRSIKKKQKVNGEILIRSNRFSYVNIIELINLANIYCTFNHGKTIVQNAIFKKRAAKYMFI